MLLGQAFLGDLGANPIEELTQRSGDWALRFLLLTLAITPVRNILGWSWLLRYRRMFGLFAIGYAFAHLLIWILLGHALLWPEIYRDLVNRPYIGLGMCALVLLIPLAVTSTTGCQRRLPTAWSRLHRLVYLSAALGVLHFYWLVKADWREPAVYAAVLAGLLALRLWRPGSTGRGQAMEHRSARGNK